MPGGQEPFEYRAINGEIDYTFDNLNVRENFEVFGNTILHGGLSVDGIIGTKRTFVEGPGIDISTTGGPGKTIKLMTNDGVVRMTVEDADITTTVPIILPSDPITSLEAATKQYVDSTVSGFGSITSLTGDVTSIGAGATVTTVGKIQGVPVLSSTPLINQVLVYNGTSWVPEDVPVTAGQAKVIYSNSIASGISTYNEETFTIPTGTQVNASVSVSSSTSPVLIQSFVTSALGVTTIPSGLWILNTYAQASSASGCSIRTEVYSRTSGGTETLLFFNDGTILSNNGNPELFSETTPQSSFTINVTDLLVIKYYATNTGGTKTVTLSYDGTNHVTNIVTPFVGYFTSLDVTGNARILGNTTTNQLTSTVSTGTSPLVVSSTTKVTNLYADRSALSDTTTLNANLSGPITSSGNTTAVASQTGTGSKFVMDTNPTITHPTLTTPILGTVTSGDISSCTGTASGLTSGNVITSSTTFPSSSFNLKGVIYANSITSITSTATAGNPGYILAADATLNPVWVAPPAGSVTSVGLSMPSQFTITGTNPITSSGTLGVTLTSSTGSGNIVLDNTPTMTDVILAGNTTAAGLSSNSLVATDLSRVLTSVNYTFNTSVPYNGVVTNTFASTTAVNMNNSSTYTQMVSGSTDQVFVLPSATTLSLYTTYEFINQMSTNVIQIYSFTTPLITNVAGSTTTLVICIDNTTSGGIWRTGIYPTVSRTIAPTSTVVQRDTYGQSTATQWKTNTVTISGTTTKYYALDKRSPRLIIIANTGVSVSNFNLPDATTLDLGTEFTFRAIGAGVTGSWQVYYYTDDVYIIPLVGGASSKKETVVMTLVSNSSKNGDWELNLLLPYSTDSSIVTGTTTGGTGLVSTTAGSDNFLDGILSLRELPFVPGAWPFPNIYTSLGDMAVNLYDRLVVIEPYALELIPPLLVVPAPGTLLTWQVPTLSSPIGQWGLGNHAYIEEFNGLYGCLKLKHTLGSPGGGFSTATVLEAYAPFTAKSVNYFGTTISDSLEIAHNYVGVNSSSNNATLSVGATVLRMYRTPIVTTNVLSHMQLGNSLGSMDFSYFINGSVVTTEYGEIGCGNQNIRIYNDGINETFNFTGSRTSGTFTTFLAPNLGTSASRMDSFFGTAASTGNAIETSFINYGSNNVANYASISLGSSGITLYNTTLPAIGFSGELDISVSNASSIPLTLTNTASGSNTLFTALSPNLSTTNTVTSYFGQAATSTAALKTIFSYTGATSTSNYAQFSVGTTSLKIDNNNKLTSSGLVTVIDNTDATSTTSAASINTIGGIAAQKSLFALNVTGKNSVNTSNLLNPPTDPIFSFLAPNLSGGNSTFGYFGQDASEGNSLRFEYHHVASNSVSNSAHISLNSVSTIASKRAYISFYADGRVEIDPNQVIIRDDTDATTTSDGGLYCTGGISAEKSIVIGGVYKSILSTRTGYTDVFKGGTAESSNDSYVISHNFVSTGSTSNYVQIGLYAHQCLQLFPFGTTASSTTSAATVVNGGLGVTDNLRVANAITTGSLTTSGVISQTASRAQIFRMDITDTTASTNVFAIANTSTSASPTTGAGTIAGGLGINDNLFVLNGISGRTLTSTVSTGTSPIVATSTTFVPNLNVARASTHPFTSITGGGATTLTVTSLQLQILTGSSGQTYTLPDATTLTPGWIFIFDNQGTGNITLNDNSSALIATLVGGTYTTVICTSISSAAGVWEIVKSFKNSTGTGSTVVLSTGPSISNATLSGTTNKFSGLTASTALALDASNNIVSVTNTGTGNNVLSASPTFTGTITASAITASGVITQSAGRAQIFRMDITDTTAATNVFAIANASDSASSNTGAGTIAGGFGVGKKLYVGDSVNVVNSVNVSSGASTTTTLASFLAPSISGGNDIKMILGRDSSVNSWTEFIHHADVSATVNNYCTIGLTGDTPAIRITSTGSMPTQQIFSGQIFTYTLTTTHSATVGAVYKDTPGNSYTVKTTISSSSTIVLLPYVTNRYQSSPADTFTLFSGTGDGSFATTTFVASSVTGTYTTPANVKYLLVTIVGGGGGGSMPSSALSTNAGGAGGGGGAAVKHLISSPSATYSYTIGIGGARATVQNTGGSTGGTTTFGTVTADGGGGGGIALSSTAVGGVGGQTGTNYNRNIIFGSGGGGANSAGGGFQASSGCGGSSGYGGGGAPGNNAAVTVPLTGCGYGGGGGGGYTQGLVTQYVAGDGAPGAIIVDEYYI